MVVDVFLFVRFFYYFWDGDRRYEYVSKNVIIGYGKMFREIKIRGYFRSNLVNYFYYLN